jgi:DNA mismatch endonuclease, patch repair protein
MRPKRNRAYWAAKVARNVARDMRNDATLADAGWLVLRVWEHEDARVAAERVQTVLAARRRDGAPPNKAAHSA